MSEHSYFTVSDLVAARIISPPMDGNHGEIHPKADDYVPDGIPFVMASDLLAGNIDFQKCKFIEKKLADNLRKGFAHEDDVLLSHKATIGRTAIIQKNKYPYVMLTPQITSYRVINKEKLLPKFLMYYFETTNFQEIFSAWAGGGSTRAYLGITAQLKLPIYVPSLGKQTAIASILSALDDKIDLNRRTNETLEAMARALFRDWFVDFGPTRAKMAGQAPYLTPEIWELFPDRLDDEGKPEGWEIQTTGNYIKNLDSRRVPLSSAQRRIRKGTYPYYGAASIVDYIDDYIFDGTYLLIGEDGTVQTKSGYSVTQYVHGKIWVNNHAHVLQGDKGVSTEHLLLHFSHVLIEPYVTGAVQPKLSQKNMNSIPFIFSSKKINLHFGENIQLIFDKILTNEVESRSLTQLRDLLLPKLMSGEIRIRDAEKMVADAL